VSAPATERRAAGRVVTVVLAALVGAAGCRAHTQDLALDQAVRDFTAQDAFICLKNRPKPVVGPSSAGTDNSPAPVDPGTDARSQLTPWIVGPNRYLIEGCGHQARYSCDAEACRIEGAVAVLTPYVAPQVSPAAVAAAASEPPPSLPASAGATAPAADDADGEAVRAALEAHRADLASCVDHLPLGLKVDYAPGVAPTISLRGDLAGKPEEGCARAVLKDLKATSFKSKGTVIHVVK
jgi:hypothetical protein